MPTKRVVVRLTPDEKQMLRELAAWNRTSMTGMIRRLIDEEHEARAKRPDGSESSATSDATA